MVDVLFTDSLCNLEIARVERGHKVRIDKERRNNIGLDSHETKLPECIKNLDVTARVSTQPVLLYKCGHSVFWTGLWL